MGGVSMKVVETYDEAGVMIGKAVVAEKPPAFWDWYNVLAGSMGGVLLFVLVVMR